MNKDLQKHLPLLEFLFNLPDDRRKNQLLNMKNEVLRFYINFIYNVYKGIYPVDNTTIQNLMPFKDDIKALLSKNKSFKSRKKILIENQFFFTLLGFLLPVIREALHKQ